MVEARLAHRTTDPVKAACHRARFGEERKALLAAWADGLAQPPAALLSFTGKAAA